MDAAAIVWSTAHNIVYIQIIFDDFFLAENCSLRDDSKNCQAII